MDPPAGLIRNQDPSWVSNNPQNSLWLIIAIGTVDRSVHASTFNGPLHLQPMPDNLSWMRCPAREQMEPIWTHGRFCRRWWMDGSPFRPFLPSAPPQRGEQWVRHHVGPASDPGCSSHSKTRSRSARCIGPGPRPAKPIPKPETQFGSNLRIRNPSYLSKDKSQRCVAHLGAVTMVFKESLVMDTKGSETNVGWLEEKERARERKVGQPSPFSGYTTKLNSNWRERMPCLRLNDRCSLWVSLTTSQDRKKDVPVKTFAIASLLRRELSNHKQIVKPEKQMKSQVKTMRS